MGFHSKSTVKNNSNTSTARRDVMGLKSLAEGIILQSMEDLWKEETRNDSIAFFKSKEFGICAELAGMNLIDQLKVLRMVKGVVDKHNSGKKASIRGGIEREKTRRMRTLPASAVSYA